MGNSRKNENYLKWKDGVDFDEVEPDWIKELANEISAIYGNDKIGVLTRDGWNNAGMYPSIGELEYDPEYLLNKGNEHGTDSILGTISHEVGHRVIHNLGLSGEITDYENEACADYIAGLTARLCKLDPSHNLSWFDAQDIVSTDKVHPGRAVRKEVFTRGLSRIDRGQEAAKLKIFETFSTYYDYDKIYQDSDLLKNILYEDVINPLRTGEIKSV